MNLKIRMLPTGSRGFTLLELIVVMAIMGASAMLIVPRLNDDSLFFSSEVRKLVALLQFNRRMAILDKQIREVRILPDSDRALTGKELSIKSDKRLWISERIDFLWKNDQLDEQENKSFSVLFFPQGGATAGELFLQMNNQKMKLSIDGFTGKISLLDDED